MANRIVIKKIENAGEGAALSHCTVKKPYRVETDLTEKFLCRFKGRYFPNFAAWQEELSLFESETYSVYRMHKSDRVETVNKKKTLLSQPLVPECMSYTRVVYVCVHFGKFISRSTGKRKSNTMSLDCPAKFALAYSQKEEKLVIKGEYNLVHNHELDEDTIDLYPKRKRLAPEEQATVLQFLEVDRSNAQVQQMINTTYNKHWSLCDVKNFKQKIKGSGCSSRIDMSQLLNLLALIKENGKAELYMTPVNVHGKEDVDLVAFSTQDMLRKYANFPEIVFIGGTVGKYRNRYKLYQLLVQDDTGRGRVIFCCFLRVETAQTQSMEQLLKVFKSFVGGAAATKTLMVEQEHEDINTTIKTIFPQAQLLLACGYVMEAIKTKALQMKWSEEEREVLLNAVRDIIRARDEEEFQQYFEQMKELSDIFSAYFEQHWLSCKETWAFHCRKDKVILRNDTISLSDIENKAVTDILKRSSRLSTVAEALYQHHYQRDCQQKRQLFREKCTNRVFKDSDPILGELYSKFTENAQARMLPEHKSLPGAVIAQRGEHFFVILNDTKNIVKHCDGKLSCICLFYLQSSLPCVHMVAVWKSESLEVDVLYSSDNSWLKNRSDIPPVSPDMGTSMPTVTMDSSPPGTSANFQNVLAVTGRLHILLASSESAIFQQRAQQLEFLVSTWEQGKEVMVAEVGSGEEGESWKNLLGNSEGEVASDMVEIVLQQEGTQNEVS